MKKASMVLNRNLFAAAAMAILVAPQLARADSNQCPLQNTTLSGLYAMSGSGTIPGVGPIASVGLVRYNGDGTGLAISLTTSVNGAATTVANVAGVYTVNTDCTGSKTFPTGHFNFVISPDGNTLTWIVTDSGITMSGTAVRQRHTD